MINLSNVEKVVLSRTIERYSRFLQKLRFTFLHFKTLLRRTFCIDLCKLFWPRRNTFVHGFSCHNIAIFCSRKFIFMFFFFIWFCSCSKYIFCESYFLASAIFLDFSRSWAVFAFFTIFKISIFHFLIYFHNDKSIEFFNFTF